MEPWIVIVIAIVAWYALGLIGSGFAVAEDDTYFAEHGFQTPLQLARRHRENIGFGVGWAIGGPITLIIGFCGSGFGQYGWWNFRRKV